MKEKVLFEFGTRADYQALETKQSNTLYFLLDTNELYRGDVPFGQAHVYIGLRENDETDEDAINRIIESNEPVEGDFAVLKTADNAADSFVYSDEYGWIHIASTLTNSIIQQVHNINVILNGSGDDPGLVDVVYNLDEKLKQLNWVTHEEFDDAVADLEALIGQPQTENTERSGIYKELYDHADTILPLFNGIIPGLVPVYPTEDTVQKAHRFLNALGNWVTVGTSGDQTVYVDPEGNTYETVEEYVTYMINNHSAVEYIWESLDE